MITISVDTETLGLDLYHSARPFFVTTCADNGSDDWQIRHWEWPVDPKTRIPTIPEDDVRQVRAYLDTADVLVAQNAKFDVTALESIGMYSGRDDISTVSGCEGSFPWHKVEDTLVASHMLYTSRKHDLTSLVTQYLNDDPDHPCDIAPFEKAVQECCESARRETRKKSFVEVYGDWKTAKKGMPGMPSAKEKCWKYDMWLPLAMAVECEYPPNHPFYTVLEEYSNADSEHTLAVWYTLKRKIEQRQLWKIYKSRMAVIPIAQRMERDSVTGSITRAREQGNTYRKEREFLIKGCVSLAREQHDYPLKLPNSGTNDSLSTFVFKTLNLPAVKRSAKTNEPSLDKDCLEHYVKTTPPGLALDFVTALEKKRKCDTALQYLEGYERFWIPKGKNEFKMHPFLNPCGTVQLRWSSSNPNSQNISKQEGFNLRYAFGPDPGYEWWSLDYQNLELRIPTFESKETKLMEVFLKPKEPPYFGSYHLVVFDVLHPEMFKEFGAKCKDEFESTWYQWVKNGNFGMIYGCGKKKADATFKVPGAFEIMRERFPNIAKLSEKQMSDARKYGYVQTIPDRSVDPDRGFPIMASRTDRGDVLPTTPLNYHVSGTACQATAKAMVRSQKQLDCWARADEWKRKFGKKIAGRPTKDAHMKMQVHDELVFCLPKSKVDPKVDLDAEKENGGHLGHFDYKSNLGYVRVLQKEMEKSGDDIGMPLPVGVEYNADNWAEVTLKC